MYVYTHIYYPYRDGVLKRVTQNAKFGTRATFVKCILPARRSSRRCLHCLRRCCAVIPTWIGLQIIFYAHCFAAIKAR